MKKHFQTCIEVRSKLGEMRCMINMECDNKCVWVLIRFYWRHENNN